MWNHIYKINSQKSAARRNSFYLSLICIWKWTEMKLTFFCMWKVLGPWQIISEVNKMKVDYFLLTNWQHNPLGFLHCFSSVGMNHSFAVNSLLLIPESQQQMSVNIYFEKLDPSQVFRKGCQTRLWTQSSYKLRDRFTHESSQDSKKTGWWKTTHIHVKKKPEFIIVYSSYISVCHFKKEHCCM